MIANEGAGLMTGKFISYAALAGFFILAVPMAASADDLEALCMSNNPIDGAATICKCISDRISGADRAGAIKALRATSAARAKGTPPDMSAWSDDMVKGMTTEATVEAGCMR
jgi:hypothetical protein